MRRSLVVYLSTLLAVLSALTGCLAAPVDVQEYLTARGRYRPNQPTAPLFKSHGYRKAALQQSTNGMFVKVGSLMRGRKIPKKMPHGMQADHILEAQTVAHAVRGGRITKSRLKNALNDVKKVFNHPSNIAFIEGAINRDKAQAHSSAMNGKMPNVKNHVKHYMQQTVEAGMNTAKKVDAIFKKHGINGVNVAQLHKESLEKAGIKVGHSKAKKKKIAAGSPKPKQSKQPARVRKTRKH